MTNARTASLTLAVSGLVLLLLILVMAKDWWDYVLLALVVLMLLGSHGLRRRSRAQAFQAARSRRGSPTQR